MCPGVGTGRRRSEGQVPSVHSNRAIASSGLSPVAVGNSAVTTLAPFCFSPSCSGASEGRGTAETTPWAGGAGGAGQRQGQALWAEGRAPHRAQACVSGGKGACAWGRAGGRAGGDQPDTVGPATRGGPSPPVRAAWRGSAELGRGSPQGFPCWVPGERAASLGQGGPGRQVSKHRAGSPAATQALWGPQEHRARWGPRLGLSPPPTTCRLRERTGLPTHTPLVTRVNAGPQGPRARRAEEVPPEGSGVTASLAWTCVWVRTHTAYVFPKPSLSTS